jgi:hypothetical protein
MVQNPGVNTFTRVARDDILGFPPVKRLELGCIYEELGTSTDVRRMRFMELDDTTGLHCYWVRAHILGRIQGGAGARHVSISARVCFEAVFGC